MSASHDKSERGSNAAFLFTVIAAYLAFFLSGGALPALQAVALIVLGILFVSVALFGFDSFVCDNSLPRRLSFFAIEIALGAASVYLSNAFGFMGLMLLPLPSYAVLMLPRRWMLAICALVVAVLAALYGSLGGWPALVQAGLGYLTGVVFVVVFTQVAANERQLRTELAEANRQLREYAAQVQDLATTQERNRLAREIHDSLGHYLTTINIQLEAAQAIAASDPPRALDALHKAQSLTKEGLAEVRRSVAALRESPTGNRSLMDALGALTEECRAAGILADLNVLGTRRPLTPQTELALYRVLQEALTNVRKHSHATRVEVTLDYGPAAGSEPGKRVCLVVRDNGVGAATAEGGFGLLGIRERVESLNGTLKTSAAPGQGFMLQMELPG